MKKFEIKTSEGFSVKCTANIPEDPRAFVIVTHGFGSSMESPTAKMMLEKLPPAGYGAVAYDLPGHGLAKEEELSLTSCIKHMKAVESYLIEQYMFPRILYFSSSFGAYVNLNYLAKEKHLGDKSFLRSAAVNMPELFLEETNPAMVKTLNEKGYILIQAGGPHTVKVPKIFFEELEANSVFDLPDPDVEVMMVHGEKDEVIDPKKALLFSQQRHIPIEMLPGEDHTLSTNPDSPEKVADMAITFFSL